MCKADCYHITPTMHQPILTAWNQSCREQVLYQTFPSALDSCHKKSTVDLASSILTCRCVCCSLWKLTQASGSTSICVWKQAWTNPAKIMKKRLLCSSFSRTSAGRRHDGSLLPGRDALGAAKRSLLCSKRKPDGQVPHEGQVGFSPDSPGTLGPWDHGMVKRKLDLIWPHDWYMI